MRACSLRGRSNTISYGDVVTERVNASQAGGVETDGRRRRSQRSRDQIIAAIMALVEEGETMPSAEAIAARAGVGLRSVFRHFKDMESLFAEMTLRVTKRFESALAPYAATDWRGQVRESMQRRLKIYHELLAFRRAADAFRIRSATVAGYYDNLLIMMRARLQAVVAPAGPRPALWFETLDLMLSTEVYERLRFEQRLDHETASALITAEVERLIA